MRFSGKIEINTYKESQSQPVALYFKNIHACLN